MADYLTTDTELTSVANAIRTKGGTSSSLVYPAGFVSAIEAISSGTDVSDTTATAGDVRTGKYFYTSAGVKTQGTIADQAAQTIHPSTTDQTIASGKYLTGTQTVKGVLLTNLDAGNIKKDVVVKVGDSTDDDCVTSVTGTYEGGGGGDVEDLLITRTISGIYSNPRVSVIGANAFTNCPGLTSVNFQLCTNIGSYAFQSCTNLVDIIFPECQNIYTTAFGSCGKITNASFSKCTFISGYAFTGCGSLDTISFPVCSSIGMYAFSGCSKLKNIIFPECEYINAYAFTSCYSISTADFPECITIGNAVFYYCYSLKNINFPKCQSIGNAVFTSCRSLATASFPSCTYIGSSAFFKCFKLVSLYLTGSSVAQLSNSNAFSSTPIAGYTNSTGGVYGSIYVPSSLLASYKAATNWTYFSARMVGI